MSQVMPFERWLLFFAATEAALSMTPGPAVLLVLSHGMSHGPWKPVWTTTGILTANALYFAISGTSLGGVLTASMPLFYGIRWLGAGYLAYLGLCAFFRRPEPVEVLTRTPAETGRPLFRQGLVLQLTNPKALVFFTALLPQFVSPGGRVGLQIVILGVTSVITEFVILAAYGALASTATRMVSNERLATWQGKVAGLLLIAAALGVASIRRESPLDGGPHFDNYRIVADRMQRLAKAFKALSNPNRLRIYTEILKQDTARLEAGCGCFITDVVRSLRIGAPTISHHVKELVNAELITVERQGKFLVCKVNPKTAALVGDLVR